jgi:hypothetical protein
MNDLPEWLAGLLIVTGILLVMLALIAVGVALAKRALRWADERDAREAAKRSG